MRDKKKKSEYDKGYIARPGMRQKKYAQQSAIYNTPQGRRRVILAGIKRRCKEKGIAFDLDKEWMELHWNEGKCEVTNIVYNLMPPSRQVTGNYAMSVDRIDPNKGYTKDNCRLVCWMFNAAKGVGTDEDIRALVEGLCRTDFLMKK